jgi:hypothetical protein
MSVFFPLVPFRDFDMNFDVKTKSYIFMMRQSGSLQFYNYHRDNKYTGSQKEKYL